MPISLDLQPLDDGAVKGFVCRFADPYENLKKEGGGNRRASITRGHLRTLHELILLGMSDELLKVGGGVRPQAKGSWVQHGSPSGVSPSLFKMRTIHNLCRAE